MNISIALLHQDMVDKTGLLVTTSLTLIDIHDIARSVTTFGAKKFYVAHPSSHIRNLARTLKAHWDVGYGSTYNPNRKEALAAVELTTSLDELIAKAEVHFGVTPILIATSAHAGAGRLSFAQCRELLHKDDQPYILMLGTGWGMSPPLLARAQLILEPINGPTPYNHLSVRSAAAIMLSKLTE